MRHWWMILLLSVMVAGARADAMLSLERVGPELALPGDALVFQLHLRDAGAAIGAFRVELGFDPAVLADVAPPQFGTQLGDTLSDALAFAAVTGPGVLYLDEVSLLESAALERLQRDSLGRPLPDLLLATITFLAQRPGAGGLAFIEGGQVFSDAAGLALAAPLSAPPDPVRVVPAPATPALLAAGALAALAARGWRRARARAPIFPA